MKKKFKIIDTSTGQKFKLGEKEMIAMNAIPCSYRFLDLL